MADQIGQGQREGQTDQKAFAAGQRPGVAGGFALPAVDDLQLQLSATLAAQQIATMQANQVTVGQMEQVIKGQPLGKLAELVALGRSDQAVEALPEVRFRRLLRDLGKQRLLAKALPGVVFKQGVMGSDLFVEAGKLRFQFIQVSFQIGKPPFG